MNNEADNATDLSDEIAAGANTLQLETAGLIAGALFIIALVILVVYAFNRTK
jgi:hypothetical protein